MQLIELHILQSFPVTCLNRDDVGAPKSAVFGGCHRARVSSQSWKRAIRSLAKEYDQKHVFSGKRTRFVIKSLKEIILKKGKAEEEANDIANVLADAIGKIDSVEKGNVKTLLYFSPLEIEAVVEDFLGKQSIETFLNKYSDAKKDEDKKEMEKTFKEVVKVAEKSAKNLAKAVKDAADIALFGRMVADDHSLMVEGAGLFSHALSTHSVSNDIDFFSAVDDELGKEDQGAGHIGTLEFNSACYYRYIGLNLGLLRDEKHLAHFNQDELNEVIKTFIKASILAVPQARKNSMFGHNPPEYVFGLRRTGQPLSLVNAFEKPVWSTNGYVAKSIEALENQWSKMNDLYRLESDVETEVKLPPDDLETVINTLLPED